MTEACPGRTVSKTLLPLLSLLTTFSAIPFSQLIVYNKTEKRPIMRKSFNPSTLKSDQHLISPYIITPESNIKVTSI